VIRWPASLFERLDFVLNSLGECEQPVAAQHPLVAASLEADRAFRDRDRDRALGVMFLQDGACVGAQRSEDAIGAANERSSLQWRARKSRRSKPGSDDDPGRAYSVEFTNAAEILREHDPIQFNSLLLLKDKLVPV